MILIIILFVLFAGLLISFVVLAREFTKVKKANEEILKRSVQQSTQIAAFKNNVNKTLREYEQRIEEMTNNFLQVKKDIDRIVKFPDK